MSRGGARDRSGSHHFLRHILPNISPLLQKIQWSISGLFQKMLSQPGGFYATTAGTSCYRDFQISPPPGFNFRRQGFIPR
jgi:hypothetical protein